MHKLPTLPTIPSCAWSKTIGEGWEQPYRVRYESNLDDGPFHGMPLGGFGAGCIGRSPRGDFNLWHLDAGEHIFANLPGCQFSIFEQVEGEEPKVYAMGTVAPEDGSLGSWQWYPAGHGTYSALYPKSWYSYEGVFTAKYVCDQFSPIVADNYQETSYPLAIFDWVIHNPSDRELTISIMFSWQNTVGWHTNAAKSDEISMRDDGSPVYEYRPRWGDSTGNFNQWIQDFHRIGCLFNRVKPHDELAEGEGQMAIATVANPFMEVFFHSRWNPAGDGRDLWDYFAMNGSLPDLEDETPASPGEQIGGAIAIKFTIGPGKTKKIPFILAWDLPVMEFKKDVTYFRRYTDFFGRTGNNAWPIIRTALKHGDMWRQRIDNWQNPILTRVDLPDWFKMALFNELYLLTDGGSLWTAATEDDPVGQFGVLECLDYRWYESLDVRLYGSFGLFMLWPRLDQSVLEAFARGIFHLDDTPRLIGYDRSMAPRKRFGATPHDLGAPNEHPWEASNYTSYQDCNQWRDLGSDFVLQVYRDYILSPRPNVEFLWECWDAIVETLTYLKSFDTDGDGLPEHGEKPDQTFDDWKLKGVSTYCGGLWIAALEAAIAIGTILENNPSMYPERLDTFDPDGIRSNIDTYQGWLAQARSKYHDLLWNGSYYRLDSESGSEIVMTDQLCGQFYAQLLKLPLVVEEKFAASALDRIYDSCYLKFAGGKYGAANGMKPDGTPENPDATHPLEVWTGINFGLAAFLAQTGKTEEAFKLTETVVRQVYDNGLQFRTPEAITATGTFRASHYLRAMAIWAIYGVMTNFKPISFDG